MIGVIKFIIADFGLLKYSSGIKVLLKTSLPTINKLFMLISHCSDEIDKVSEFIKPCFMKRGI